MEIRAQLRPFLSPALAAIAVGAVAVSAASLSGALEIGPGQSGGSVRPAPGHEIAAGRLADGRSATAPRSDRVTVVADPHDGTELVAYHARSGELCIGHIGRGLGGGTCPEALQRGAADHIFVEGYNRDGGADVLWGFAPAATQELVVTDASGTKSSVPVYDAGREFGDVRFFMAPISLTNGELELRAINNEGETIISRKAGSDAPPPPESPS